MKSFQQFQEDLSRNTIKLGRKEQESLSRALPNQIGPRSRPVPNTKFTLEPANIPMK
jgi:hypothetical protein